MVDVDNDVSLDTVYKYTERCVDGCSRSFNGLRNRIGLFLGSGSLLIRLAWDLDNSPLRLMTVILSTAVVIYSTFALKPENIGDSVAPVDLLDDDFFYQGEEFHKGGIVNGWVKSLEGYETAIARKQHQLWVSICLFSSAIAVYALGVILG
jgi:hypothetical protein